MAFTKAHERPHSVQILLTRAYKRSHSTHKTIRTLALIHISQHIWIRYDIASKTYSEAENAKAYRNIEYKMRSRMVMLYESVALALGLLNWSFGKLLAKTHCVAPMPSKSMNASPSSSNLTTWPCKPTFNETLNFLLFDMNCSITVTC